MSNLKSERWCVGRQVVASEAYILIPSFISNAYLRRNLTLSFRLFFPSTEQNSYFQQSQGQKSSTQGRR
jgi:hypothetical protein